MSWGVSSCRKWGVVCIFLRVVVMSFESLVCFLNERDNGGRIVFYYVFEKNYMVIV